MSLKRLYGKFTKIEEQADGTLLVEGVASSETVDSQGEVIKASAMAAALPDYMKFPTIREMHTAWAAGKTMAAAVDEQGLTHIATKVVDAEAIKKVKEGVYAGFSIGGNVPPGGRSKDNPKVIERIDLKEISLVDRPANPDAVITVYKAEGIEKGMYTVAWAAELCQSLANLGTDTQWEADYEGDGSAIPGRIKVLCAEFAAILRDLVAEETAELIGDAAGEAEAVEMVNKPGALKKSETLAALVRPLVEKKGAKFSASTKKALQDHHDELGKLYEAFGKLGWKDGETKEDADPAGNLAKLADAEKARSEALAKVAEIEKRATEAEDAAAQAGSALKKILEERDTLSERLKERDALLASKGVLKVVAVEKAKDGGTAVEEKTDTVSLIKKAQMNPIRMLP